MALHTRRRRLQPPALVLHADTVAPLSRAWAVSRVCTLPPARGWAALLRAALDSRPPAMPRSLWQGCLIRLPMRRVPALIRLRMLPRLLR